MDRHVRVRALGRAFGDAVVGAKPSVGKRHARDKHLDARVADIRTRIVFLDDLQHFGTAVALHDDAFCHFLRCLFRATPLSGCSLDFSSLRVASAAPQQFSRSSAAIRRYTIPT